MDWIEQMAESGCDTFAAVGVELCGDSKVRVSQCHRCRMNVAIGVWFQVELNHDVAAGAWPISAEKPHQLRIHLDLAIQVFAFGFEVFCAFDFVLVIGRTRCKSPWYSKDRPPITGYLVATKTST